MLHEISTVRIGPGFARQRINVLSAVTSAGQSPNTPILSRTLISPTLPCESIVTGATDSSKPILGRYVWVRKIREDLFEVPREDLATRWMASLWLGSSLLGPVFFGLLRSGCNEQVAAKIVTSTNASNEGFMISLTREPARNYKKIVRQLAAEYARDDAVI